MRFLPYAKIAYLSRHFHNYAKCLTDACLGRLVFSRNSAVLLWIKLDESNVGFPLRQQRELWGNGRNDGHRQWNNKFLSVANYLAFPQLRYVKRTCEAPSANGAPVEPFKSGAGIGASSAVEAKTCGVLLKTMTPEEQKVLNVLVAHQGKYLQKYLVKEAGLSRLKTHRIIARFAQRGIVTVKEFGNTNEVLLSEWVSTSIDS